MAFVGNKLPFDFEQEVKSELTIALDTLKGSNDKKLFNNVLEVFKNYIYGNEVVYLLKNNNIYCTIHDYDNDYYVVFSNKYLANKFNAGKYTVSEVPFVSVLKLLLFNRKISGLNLDRATCGLLIETPKLLEKIFGTRDIYNLNIKDWGKGVPDYNLNQLMNPEMLLDFGLQVVHNYLVKTGYVILHGANRLDSAVNIVASKDNKLAFITVDAAVAPQTPTIENNKRIDALELAYKFGAEAFYAPVSFGSTDPERFDKSIALQGDSYYAKFVELETIESQYN